MKQMRKWTNIIVLSDKFKIKQIILIVFVNRKKNYAVKTEKRQKDFKYKIKKYLDVKKEMNNAEPNIRRVDKKKFMVKRRLTHDRGNINITST